MGLRRAVGDRTYFKTYDTNVVMGLLLPDVGWKVSL